MANKNKIRILMFDAETQPMMSTLPLEFYCYNRQLQKKTKNFTRRVLNYLLSFRLLNKTHRRLE